ncbi:MAG TPA: hypothetical protein VJJ70_08605 [Anaerolineales bacterium]|nr:hypothetical protein [Anaerolineales bacterium]
MLRFLPFFSTIVTILFAALVFARYRRRGGTHLLIWTVGLLLYALGTAMEALLGLAFHPLALKVWYLTGAMLTAAWLGQGTMFLLVRRRGVAPVFLGVLAVVSLLSAWLVFSAPTLPGSYDVLAPASAQYREILARPGGAVGLTIILNLYGTLLLVGGALWSAWLFWRKQVLVHRVLGNVLIAAGALAPALGGTFLRLGLVDWLYVSELLGAAIMFVGFVQATVPQKSPNAAPERAAARAS